jgi:hypothetical protein
MNFYIDGGVTSMTVKTESTDPSSKPAIGVYEKSERLSDEQMTALLKTAIDQTEGKVLYVNQIKPHFSEDIVILDFNLYEPDWYSTSPDGGDMTIKRIARIIIPVRVAKDFTEMMQKELMFLREKGWPGYE